MSAIKSKLLRMDSNEYEMLEELVKKSEDNFKKINQSLVLRALIRMAYNHNDLQKQLEIYIKEVKAES